MKTPTFPVSDFNHGGTEDTEVGKEIVRRVQDRPTAITGSGGIARKGTEAQRKSLGLGFLRPLHLGGRHFIHRFLFLALCSLCLSGFNLPGRAAEQPPEPKREFRGAWIATVYNLDWPSKPGLSSEQQQAELRSMLDRAAELKLNAIVFQVRPQCDALYASKREPWSPFLSGKMGRAPEPFYDPLEFAIAEAHARGLELHAWFNPFRALANAETPVTGDHVSKRHPEWVRRYGNQLWLDPGEPAARDLAREVILDVVRRYDVDGIHLDDYFYPYPVKGKSGGALDFPDEASFRHAGVIESERDDWRRANINDFVVKLYRGIKAEKRWVKFGISPFGIWRPRVPESIEAGLDSFGQLYADSGKWLREGWCDYFSPQLYWGIEPAKQSFPVLLKWWESQNTAKRHLWPGIATDRVGPNRAASEIANQIIMTHGGIGSAGHIHWDLKALLRNPNGLAELLRGSVYREFALVPASPWLGNGSVEKPALMRGEGQFRWHGDSESPCWWLVQTRRGKTWSPRLVPGARLSVEADPAVEAIAVRAINRVGDLGEAAVLELR